jgi:hypothetical protein
VVVREFLVSEGRERDFEGIFGPGGIWPEFLRRSRQFLGSWLSLESESERRYQLRDYWMSHVGFEAFRAIHQLDCDRFDQLIKREKLVVREQFLGAFYVGDPDLDEGDELVPS